MCLVQPAQQQVQAACGLRAATSNPEQDFLPETYFSGTEPEPGVPRRGNSGSVYLAETA